MKIHPVQPLNFKSKTLYEENLVTEKDVLTLDSRKEITTNPVTPSQRFLGVYLTRVDKQSINLVSGFGNKTGEIKYNPSRLQPKIDVLAGNFQPLIELRDDELGIRVLMARKSKLSGENLNIDYKEKTQQRISFGHKLVVTTGYKPEQTESAVNDFFAHKSSNYVPLSPLLFKNENHELENEYTFVALAAGKGTRLKPISDKMQSYDGVEFNKPASFYPNKAGTLIEISALSHAVRAGINQKDVDFVHDGNNCLGTAGSIIRGLKNGKIPLDKPLVVLMSDSFNNIDINRVLKEHEQFGDSGVTIVTNLVSRPNMIDKAPIKINSAKEVLKFYDSVNKDNYRGILNDSHDLYGYHVSSGIVVISPEILSIMKNCEKRGGYCDLTEFIGLAYNILVTKNETLANKYNFTEDFPFLRFYELADWMGRPKDITNKHGDVLKMHVVEAKAPNSETPVFYDAGTVSGYIDAIKHVKNTPQINNIPVRFTDAIKEAVDDSGVIYMNPEAKDRLELFKKKYNIDSFEGNVIVVSSNKLPKTQSNEAGKRIPKDLSGLYQKTSNPEVSGKFVSELLSSGSPGKKMRELILDYGMSCFIKWYLSNDGYLGAYSDFIKNRYKDADSLDELLKIAPNWNPWMLEKKAWEIANPAHRNSSESIKNQVYEKSLGGGYEYGFSLGELDGAKLNKSEFSRLIKDIKTTLPIKKTYNFQKSSIKVNRLKGGELNDKFVYLFDNGTKKFILKLDRINVEDVHNVNNRELSKYEKKSIRRNKHMMPDSLYLDACLTKYLELNGCESVPKLQYYDYENNAALYEYVEGKEEDLFQKGEIDDEQEALNCPRQIYKDLANLGIFINDRSIRNILKDFDGNEKLIDLGHAAFIMPFKPTVKDYQLELPNACGPDARSIYSSILFAVGGGFK